MDPFTMPAEIAAILGSATDMMPAFRRKGVKKQERKEAYLAFQRENYRLMACASHLSVLGQIRVVSWQDWVVAAIPMIEPFLRHLIEDNLRKRFAWREIIPMIETAGDLTKASSLSSTTSLAVTLASEPLLQYQVISELASVRDAAAGFLAALAEVRLVGRPAPVAAANVTRGLFQELFLRIPVQKPRSSIFAPPKRAKKAMEQKQRAFDDCLSALGEAHAQFMRATQADQPGRNYLWQVWRTAHPPVTPAEKLLAAAGRSAGHA
jgi:hypothetical protein